LAIDTAPPMSALLPMKKVGMELGSLTHLSRGAPVAATAEPITFSSDRPTKPLTPLSL
jgi:hypothetical protein